MTSTTQNSGTEKSASTQRYRLPGIVREGIAQLSILETALWPVQGGQRASFTFDSRYKYTVEKQQRDAQVSVYAPLGLESVDEYILWGLLGLSLSHKHPDPTLLATPYWIIKKLGMSVGGSQYAQLRASLERLALVAYQNTAFYNPVTQEHERVTFHFFSCFLPTRDRGASVDTERSWRIEWSPTFFKMCQATGGTLLFDLDLYRELTPAARRLFLKLKDRFCRTKRVFMNVDDLTIHGLGLSADRPLKKRKYDLTACIQELLDHGVIELGKGQTDPKELFLKRGKGVYVVQFFEGAYFRRPLSPRTQDAKESLTDDPLYQPLKAIGVDEAGIRRLFQECSRGLLQRWINVTDVAMHEKPRGFPGFKASPAAFFVDAVQNNRLPPDWIYEHEREAKRQQWEADRRHRIADEASAREQYETAKAAALQTYLQSSEGQAHFQRLYPAFHDFYRIVDPHQAETSARKATTDKIEREHLAFSDFGVWLLEGRLLQS